MDQFSAIGERGGTDRVELFEPSSVVDVGCGVGHWLAEFQRLGVDDVTGVDGGYVDRDRLRIPVECFHAHDLGEPLRLSRAFDLAMSVELAEHLDEQAADSSSAR
jgi:2-polyprenyl-3-methyl-5-hydroxy-6-metoxy-1,4-benzoquinol methylase